MDKDARSLLEPTIGLTEGWLAAISERAECSPDTAFGVLRAGLHALRDCMSDEAAAMIAQEFPALIRGLWFEGWRPGARPVEVRHLADWLVTLEGHLLAADADAVAPGDAADAIFAVVRRHLGASASHRLEARLPHALASHFRTA